MYPLHPKSVPLRSRSRSAKQTKKAVGVCTDKCVFAALLASLSREVNQITVTPLEASIVHSNQCTVFYRFGDGQLVPVQPNAAAAQRLRVLRGQQLGGRQLGRRRQQDPHHADAQDDLARRGERVPNGRVSMNRLENVSFVASWKGVFSSQIIEFITVREKQI